MIFSLSEIKKWKKQRKDIGLRDGQSFSIHFKLYQSNLKSEDDPWELDGDAFHAWLAQHTDIHN